MRRWHKLGSGLAAAVLAIAGSACVDLGGGSDDGDEGATLEVTEDAAAGEPEAGELQSDDGSPGDGGDDEPEAGELQAGSGERATPEDVSIERTVRHPGGTVLSVTDVTFSGNEIRVGAELINGATNDITVALGGGNRLRLVDDLGGEYNFVVPDDLRDRNIELGQGQSIGGDFVFLGPVASDASRLTLAANVSGQNPQPTDMESASTGQSAPNLVLDGIDLSW
jgi:hypothetical protein